MQPWEVLSQAYPDGHAQGIPIKKPLRPTMPSVFQVDQVRHIHGQPNICSRLSMSLLLPWNIGKMFTPWGNEKTKTLQGPEP